MGCYWNDIMDPQCLDNQLSEAERVQFRDRGFLMIDNVLEPDHVADLVDIVDRIDGEECARLGHGPKDRINHFDFIDFPGSDRKKLVEGAVPVLAPGRVGGGF